MYTKARLVLPAVLLAATALAACSDANSSAGSVVSGSLATCSYPSDGEPARAVDPPETSNIQASGTATATISLTAGDINITMDRAKAPCNINSFESLAEQGFFDDTDCHRLVDTGIFILQCGDPSATGTGGPGYTVPDELGPDTSYPAGTVAMANRSVANTAGSQFFLVYADTELPPDYTVLGTMDQASIDVVGDIASQGVDAADGTSPIAEAHIESVTLG